VTAAVWDDGDFIDECLQRGEASRPMLGVVTSDRCRWCGHVQHGFQCPGSCRCDSSFSSRDDSWRPPSTTSPATGNLVRELAHNCGVDGWTAQAAVIGACTPADQARAWRVKQALLNPYITPRRTTP
jgi:hypothetical protein